MKKVYIVYQKDVFGGMEIDKVFSSKNIARKYVIDEIFRNNKFYHDKDKNELNDLADWHIDEFDICFK